MAVKAQVGFTGLVEVSSNGSTWTTLGGVTSTDFEDIMNEIDSTTFGDTNVRRVYGLGDCTSSVSGLWDASDAGQVLVRTNKAARDNIFVRYLPDGTSGFSAEFICTSIGTSQSVDDRVEVAYEFALADGSVTVV